MVKRGEAVDAFLHHRMIETVSHQVSAISEYDPRRLDAAPTAVVFLALDDPVRDAMLRVASAAAASGSAS